MTVISDENWRKFSNATIIADYLEANFSKEDAEKLSKVKMLGVAASQELTEKQIHDIVDKVALFNSIKKKGL